MCLTDVYVNDILVTDSDIVGIGQIKEHLRTYFVTKDIGKSRYFLRIEFTYGKQKMTLSQKKYVVTFSIRQIVGYYFKVVTLSRSVQTVDW